MEEFGVGDALTQAFLGYVLTIVVALATAGVVALIVRTLEGMQARKAAKLPVAPAAVSVAVAPEQDQLDETARHVAAIAAAVYAVVGAHRLVHIAEVGAQPGWRTAGRLLHQSSHTIRRSAKP